MMIVCWSCGGRVRSGKVGSPGADLGHEGLGVPGHPGVDQHDEEPGAGGGQAGEEAARELAQAAVRRHRVVYS